MASPDCPEPPEHRLDHNIGWIINRSCPARIIHKRITVVLHIFVDKVVPVLFIFINRILFIPFQVSRKIMEYSVIVGVVIFFSDIIGQLKIRLRFRIRLLIVGVSHSPIKKGTGNIAFPFSGRLKAFLALNGLSDPSGNGLSIIGIEAVNGLGMCLVRDFPIAEIVMQVVCCMICGNEVVEISSCSWTGIAFW